MVECSVVPQARRPGTNGLAALPAVAGEHFPFTGAVARSKITTELGFSTSEVIGELSSH